ncbi:MAG: amidase [Acidimicrobiales bacterium]
MPSDPLPDLTTLTDRLRAGSLTASALVERCLAAIDDPAGEGARAFWSVAAERARASAAGVDLARAGGGLLPPLAGLPVAIKDLFDVAGEVTTAGSSVLAEEAPAATTAPAVARLIAAGLIPIGRTAMTEFAFSGLGLNAHHPTPSSRWGRAEEPRIPGGSSSGSAVAVADGMAPVGLGTDTGGSCRIPAAFNGLVGWKPSAGRVPLAGVVPLAPSLDSVGVMAATVADCALLDLALAGPDGGTVPGGSAATLEERPAARIHLAAVTDYVLDDLDPHVAAVFEHGLGLLRAAGVTVTEVGFPELLDLPEINAGGGLAAAEAYQWHRPLLARGADRYDPRVRRRIEAGASLDAAAVLDAREGRSRLQAAAARRLAGFDAFVLPTVAITAPTIAAFEAGDAATAADYYATTNLLCLRNTSVANMLDGCAITIPAPVGDAAPVGCMLMGGHGTDRTLLGLASAVEAVFARR